MDALKEELLKIRDQLTHGAISEDTAFSEGLRVCRLSGSLVRMDHKEELKNILSTKTGKDAFDAIIDKFAV
jgi:hypothetical protein